MPRQTSTQRARLQVEKLEARRLLAADFSVDAASLMDTAYDLSDKVAEVGWDGAKQDVDADRLARRSSNHFNSQAVRAVGAFEGSRDGRLEFAGRDDPQRLAANLESPLQASNANRMDSWSRMPHVPVRAVSVLLSRQNSIGEISLTHIIAIRRPLPLIVRDVRILQTESQPSPAHLAAYESRANAEMAAEGESAVDDWQFPEPYSNPGNRNSRVGVSVSDFRSPDPTFFVSSLSGADVSAESLASTVSSSVLGAAELNGLQTQGGFVELSNGSADQVAGTTPATGPSQSQFFLLNEPQLDLSSFSYWLGVDGKEIKSEDLIDLIDLIELLGDDADVDDDEQSDEVTADDTDADVTSDADADTTERVFSNWAVEAHQGMIQLSRSRAVGAEEGSHPSIEAADVDTTLQELTLELDAVIGSVRAFELGDAETELENEDVDSTEPVESHRPQTDSHDDPLASRAAWLPLILTAMHRRVGKLGRWKVLGSRFMDRVRT